MHSENFQDLFLKTSSYSCSANEIILLFGTAVLLLILLAEFVDWQGFVSSSPPCKSARTQNQSATPIYEYGYDDDNGPVCWKAKFPEARGCKQSPINITCKNSLVCPVAPLKWSDEYTCAPDCIRIMNDGHCVSLQMRFTGMRPTLCGGPLRTSYDLYNIRFRWGPTDDEGSEHTIDYRRFAMEMQAVHVRSGCNCEGGYVNICENNTVLIVSYVFQPTSIDNPYLDPVISKLPAIKYPGSKCMTSAFPICWLLPAFASDYYMYQGSLTYPPCTEGIQWLIQPEPLAISPRQVRKFRKLINSNGDLMLTNARPIQNTNNREFFYYTCDDCKCN